MAAKETFVPKRASEPEIELVCIGRPFTDQTTPRSLPCGSETKTVTMFVLLQGTAAGSGHVMIGAAWLRETERLAARRSMLAGFIDFIFVFRWKVQQIGSTKAYSRSRVLREMALLPSENW
jgi:hypothetical protein